jgi:hypothetical protein
MLVDMMIGLDQVIFWKVYDGIVCMLGGLS